jgi:hypothetical protein
MSVNYQAIEKRGRNIRTATAKSRP